MSDNFKQKLQNVNTFIFDVDGVLTNGTLLVLPGELHRTMNIRDGYALKEAVTQGYNVFIISGGKSESVRKRLTDLGIKNIYLGIEDKKAKLKEITEEFNLNIEQVLYMGDDLPDYEVMQVCGIPCCPADATHEIKNISLYVSPQKGGDGCARDVIEQVLRLQNKWPYSNRN
ncbi:MAG TPA: HAD hydrolase family protein [Bacteroidia bacterium]|nr:HAD hydrolase family protein [Bacteroidia bacterium]HNS13479.1 HAD hydrolase family protein [Bacteroidia bacterium]